MRRPTLNYLKTESGSGLILALAAALAVLIANSVEAPRYAAFVSWPITLQGGPFAATLSLGEWVKSGLMAVFFLVVGMQIKFEVLRGELSSPRRLAVPAMAALGGLVAPAAVFLACNLGPGGFPGAWPIPTATDIALALAMLALAGPRLPPSLRVFLLTVALADDLGGVGLVAALYSRSVNWEMLGGAALALALLVGLSRWRRAPFLFYAAGFVVVWAFTLKSGVSTSAAGIACAMTVPVGARRTGQDSVLKYFMDSLHPYVAFAVLPLFVFTAAGVSLRDLSAHDVTAAVPLGVALGLWLGKPIGVFGFAALGVVLRFGRRPSGASWAELLGVAMLCGIGLTMSLFVGALAVGAAQPHLAGVRLGVVAGSLLSGLIGLALLRWADQRRAAEG
ncbi:MAG: Na+/H+ antiporter NhaA [Caulobacterales bacterium]